MPFKISHAFQTGKDVPVVVPEDVRRILQYLADSEVRRAAGISTANPYIFANNGKSKCAIYFQIIY